MTVRELREMLAGMPQEAEVYAFRGAVGTEPEPRLCRVPAAGGGAEDAVLLDAGDAWREAAEAVDISGALAGSASWED